MTLLETDTVLWFFIANAPAETCDFLCVTVKRSAEHPSAAGKLEGEYRLRYSRGPGFDSSDEIVRYRLGPIDDTPEARGRLHDGIRRMVTLSGMSGFYEKEINGDHRALQAAMLDAPGLMVKATQIEVPR